jgi:dihydroorotate dehydrogenase
MTSLPMISPYINAAGALGMAPHGAWTWQEPQGAFVTSPISRHARQAAANRCARDVYGLALLHSGLPNQGIRAVLRQFSKRWTQSTLPIWVHIIPASSGESVEMLQQLEDCEGVSAVEISLPEHALFAEWREVLADSTGSRLPIIAAISITAVTTEWLNCCAEQGAAGINLTAPRGSWGGVHGRLYGPALLPLASQALEASLQCHLPVIISAGVFTLSDANALLAQGAAAVGLDTVLW